MEYVEIFFDECLKETDEAVLLNFDTETGFNFNATKWIPKSCIEDGFRAACTRDSYIKIERWFAEKEGLI